MQNHAVKTAVMFAWILISMALVAVGVYQFLFVGDQYRYFLVGGIFILGMVTIVEVIYEVAWYNLSKNSGSSHDQDKH